MRLLHTSDWHLGQTFFGHSRTLEHRAFLEALVRFCVSESPDVLLVCGDIFDTINPPAEAEETWYAFLARLAREAPHVRVNVIAGNHDSAARLGAPRGLMAHVGVEVHERATFVAHMPAERGADNEGGKDLGVSRINDALTHPGSLEPLEPLVSATSPMCRIPKVLCPETHLRLVKGASGVEVCLGLVPFLRPSDAPGEYGVDGTRPLQEWIAFLYERLSVAARARHPHAPLVLTGHLYAEGGLLSELSERKIQRGNLEALPIEAIAAGCCYFALGHLHRAQGLSGGRVRYCGSPLPLSFTEAHYPHQVVRVDVSANGATSVVPLRLPRARRLLRIPEVPATPEETLAACDALIVEPGELPPFVEVRVALAGPRPGLRADLEARLSQRGALLVQYVTTRANTETASGGTAAAKAENDTEALTEAQTEALTEAGAQAKLPAHAPPAKTSLHDFSALEIFERCYVAEFGAVPDDEIRRSFLECVELAQAGATPSTNGEARAGSPQRWPGTDAALTEGERS
jgi:exonuclease SbcD